MPQVTVYIRAEDAERWAAVEKKSEFIHVALIDFQTETNYRPGVRTKPAKLKEIPTTTPTENIKVNKDGTLSPKNPKKPATVDTLLAIPGVERASDAKCKGAHYMSREDCGKAWCPWA